MECSEVKGGIRDGSERNHRVQLPQVFQLVVGMSLWLRVELRDRYNEASHRFGSSLATRGRPSSQRELRDWCQFSEVSLSSENFWHVFLISSSLHAMMT